MPGGHSPSRRLLAPTKTSGQPPSVLRWRPPGQQAQTESVEATPDHDQRLDELELLLRQLTAQARDVVQELGEIKAEIEHINSLDDTLDALPLPSTRALGAGSSVTDVVRALHSNFRERESSLGADGQGEAPDEHTRDRLKAMERVMASAMLRSVADSREPPAAAAAAAAAARARLTDTTASEQPGKWPKFGQDTITRFERGIASRGGTGRLPQILNASGTLDRTQNQAPAPSPAHAQAASVATGGSQTPAAEALPAAIVHRSSGPGRHTANDARSRQGETLSPSRTARRSSGRKLDHLTGLTGSPLGWGPRIGDGR
jgi:hypothetical protein